MIIHNPILTGSFTVNGTDVASITSSAASITAINSYTASQNILNGTYATTSSNTFKNPQTINSNLIVTGSITAQTLVVQTVSSSVVYSSGSNVFGNNIANTQVFTGSMNLTGSLTVITTGTEFQVTSTGVRIGNISTDTHPITGSVYITGSTYIGGPIGTAASNLISAPNTSLFLQSSVNAIQAANTNNVSTGSIILTHTTGTGAYMIISKAGSVGDYGGYIQIQDRTAAAYYPLLLNPNGGNVGIGTSSPNGNLEVYAATPIIISGASSSGTLHGLEFRQSNTIDAFIKQLPATGELKFSVGRNSSWGGNMTFFTDTVQRMNIPSTGGLNILTSTGDGFCIQFNSGFKLRADSATQLGIVNSGITAYADLRVNNMTKASGTFRISHPLESLSETHDLVHSFIEGPRADLIYRGKVTLVNGTATINIDETVGMTEGTFVALNRDIQCFTTNESGWDLVKGKVEGNILTITSQNTESTNEISWMVVGERQDKHIKDTDWTDENGKPILEPSK
jgi:hypothetical protein